MSKAKLIIVQEHGMFSFRNAWVTQPTAVTNSV